MLDASHVLRDNVYRGNKKCMQQKKEIVPWWQPGMKLFLRLSSWIGGPVIVAVLIGKYLDQIFNSQPWILLASVTVSFVVSMVMLVIIGLSEMDKEGKK